MENWTDAQALRYMASFADLRPAFGADPEAGRRDFREAGAAEGRTITFDPLSYIASYSDLISAFGADAAKGAWHYINYGSQEGRAVSFDPLAYIASYPDLIRAYGTDAAAGARHYIQVGMQEGRAVSFDPLAYIASYPDLIRAYGTDAAAGARHYIQAGLQEGRAITFDSVAYLLSYPDLSAAGLNSDAALRHWVASGYAEGRSATGAFGNEQTNYAFSNDTQISGMINVAGDKDWYQLDLVAGNNVTIDVSGITGGLVSLRNANGQEVASGSKLNFNAPVTGTFYVTVSAALGATGSYTLGSKPYHEVTGTSAEDTLTGTNGADVLRGLDEGDTLEGGGGNDVLEGGAGADTLDGGMGDDILYGNNAGNIGVDTSTDNLRDQDGGDDKLYGQDGDDDLVVDRAGNNISASNVLLDGGAGNDYISFYSRKFIDTVTIISGSGNDTITSEGALQSNIDAGEGNDKVTVDMTGGNHKITLGTGADVLTLMRFSGVGSLSNPKLVTDFLTGTDRLIIDGYLLDILQGWNRVTNPFSSGYLKIVQNGAETDLLLDRDGSIGNGFGFTKVMTFLNTSASSFTANDFGYAPDGSLARALTIAGTFADDTLYGNNGADTLRGLDGTDFLEGRGGNDVLEGGRGSDQLNGGLGDDILYGNNAGNIGFDDYFFDVLVDDLGGNDQLFGQDGDDELVVLRNEKSIPASNVLLDGGTGNDRIEFTSFRYIESGRAFIDTVTIVGGFGNDSIASSGAFQSNIDAGDGDDRVTIGMTGGNHRITLGTGVDILKIEGHFGAFTKLTDFRVGTDKLLMGNLLEYSLQGWDKSTNPFAGGYLKLVQNGVDTDLMIDRDGSVGNTYSFAKLLTFEKTVAANFTAADLGYAPGAASASSFRPSIFSMEGAQAEAANVDLMIGSTAPFGDFSQDTMMFNIDTTAVPARDAMAIALEKSPNFDWQGGADAVGLTETTMVHFDNAHSLLSLAHSRSSFEAVI